MSAEQKQRKLHTCTICGYETPYTSNMKHHLQKLLPCGNVAFDDERFLKMKAIYVDKTESNKTKEYKCEYCNKQFKFRNSIYSHKKICTAKMKLEDEIQLMKNQIKELQERATSTIINNNIQQQNNNIQQNNIIIQKYGEEDLSPVLKNIPLLDQCLKRRDKGHVELMEYIHFRIPENRNVSLSKQRNTVLAYDGEVQVRKDKDDVYEEIIHKSKDILTDHFDDHKQRLVRELSESWIHNISQYLDKVENNDFDTIIKLKDGLDVIMQKITNLLTKK